MNAIPHYVCWLLGLKEPETQTTPAERDCLARHAGGRRRVVEIGVWHGVTTKRLRGAMAADGWLTAVDPFPAGRLGFSAAQRIAHREAARVRNGRLRWVRATGAAAADGHESIDFVFIDGDHTEEGLMDDWTAWSSLVVPGGIVAIHDSRSTPDRSIDDAGSVKVTSGVILKDARFEMVEQVDSLTVVRRRALFTADDAADAEDQTELPLRPQHPQRPLQSFPT
jgi:predicted O-methyltransferase YrrM